MEAHVALLIRDGRVLDSASGQFRVVDVLVDGGRVTEVGADLSFPAGSEIIDAAGYLVILGLVNAHTHAHNNLTRGVADNWTLEDLLNHGPALLNGRTAREQYVSAAIGAIEMLKSGCTAAYDLFMAFPAPTDEGAEAVARGYGDSGMRAVVAPAVADQVFYQTVPGLIDQLPDELRAAVESIEVAPAGGLLAMMERHIRRWHGSYSGRIQAAVAPTIPGQCTDEFLRDSARLASEHGVGFHTHLAETKMQVIHAHQRWGMSPLAVLAELGAVNGSFVGAHGIWLSGSDIEQLGASRATIAHNPASNLKLGSGIAPVRELIDAGVNVALGTDGSSCSDNQNMFGAMHFAGTIGNVRFPHDPERWVSAPETLRMATDAGMRALGIAERGGAIEPGAPADLVLLDASSIYLRPLNDAYNSLVYVENGASVDTVIVDGEVVVRHGIVLTLDEPALRDEAQEIAERLASLNPDRWAFARKLTPYVRAACRGAAAAPLPFERYAADSSAGASGLFVNPSAHGSGGPPRPPGARGGDSLPVMNSPNLRLK
jgi:5-methylthioadenosine/S-adenosylhomocysteine deaminase